MGVSVTDVIDGLSAIDGLLQRHPPFFDNEEDDHLYRMIFSQLSRSRQLLGNLFNPDPGFNLPTNFHRITERRQVHYKELFRVVTRITTQLEKHQAGQDISTSGGEYMLDNFLDLRWWTLVIALQHCPIDASEHFLDNVDFTSLKKDVSETKFSRSLPSYVLERWMPEVWEQLLDKPWSDFDERLDVENQQLNMLRTEIRNAELPEFDIKLSTSIRKAQKPSSMQDHLVIDLTQDFLGASSEGYVIRTTCLGKACALKRIDTVDGDPPDLASLSHPHVVHLKHHWSEKSGPHDEARGLIPKPTFMTFLVMEFMHGDLAKLMRRTKRTGVSPFSLPVSVDLMLQVAKGMLYLHEMGVSHPHLRCENILCRIETSREVFHVGDVLVKLGGFGCSRSASANSKIRDILCFGLTCLEILTGDEAIDIIGLRPSVPETTPPFLKYCIENCLEPELSASKLAFPQVVMLLLVAKLQIIETCEDSLTMLPSSNPGVENMQPENQDSAFSSRSNCGLHEMFHVHQLHPQPEEGVSTSNQSTLIFFHGFPKVSEEWRMTWMTRDNQLLWPEKWLPEDVCHDIRVLSVSYDDHLDVSSDQYLLEISKNVLQSLVLSSQWNLGESNQAVTLVGHSFGGVIIKALVSEAQKESRKSVGPDSKNFVEVMKCRAFLKNLASIVFFAVPHALLDTEFENYLLGCSTTRVLQRCSLLKSLRGKTNRFVQDMIQLSADFESAVPKMKILAFLEGKPMIKKTFIVTRSLCEESFLSWECHTVPKDNHFEVCRPNSKDHVAYKTLVQHLLEENMDIHKEHGVKQHGLKEEVVQGQGVQEEGVKQHVVQEQGGKQRGGKEKGVKQQDVKQQGVKYQHVQEQGRREHGVKQWGADNKNDVNSSHPKIDLTTSTPIVSGSKNLTSLISITAAVGSLKLDSSLCLNLKELPYDQHLQHLDVSGYENLTSLVGIAHAPTLHKLNASGCSNLTELSNDFGKLKQLQFLDVSGCKGLTSLDGIVNAPALHELKASRCCSLRELPNDFSGLTHLQFLDVSGCEDLTSLDGIVSAPTLHKLKASWCCSLRELPNDFSGLTQLQFLDVSGCKGLTSLDGIVSAPALHTLKAFRCSSLRKLPDDFSGMKQLQSFDVSGCTGLTSLDGIVSAPALHELKAFGCSNLTKLPNDFSGLKWLQSFDVSGCTGLTSLDSIVSAPTLQELKASRCCSLRELPNDFSGLKFLEFLDVSGCEGLISLDSIVNARALQKLKAFGCSNLRELPNDFSGLKRLQFLDVSGCEHLTSLDGIANAPALLELQAFGCSNLRELPNDFSGLKRLQFLDVSGCEHLTSLDGIANAPALLELQAFECSRLKKLPNDFSGLKRLQCLDVSGCKGLTSLGGIVSAPAMHTLKASGCSSLRELPYDFTRLNHLQFLDVRGCNLGEGINLEAEGSDSKMRRRKVAESSYERSRKRLGMYIPNLSEKKNDESCVVKPNTNHL